MVPGVDVGHSFRGTVIVNKQPRSPKESDGGTTIRPNGPVESESAKISSTVRIPSQTIELSGRIHKKHIEY